MRIGADCLTNRNILLLADLCGANFNALQIGRRPANEQRLTKRQKSRCILSAIKRRNLYATRSAKIFKLQKLQNALNTGKRRANKKHIRRWPFGGMFA